MVMSHLVTWVAPRTGHPLTETVYEPLGNVSWVQSRPLWGPCEDIYTPRGLQSGQR